MHPILPIRLQTAPSGGGILNTWTGTPTGDGTPSGLWFAAMVVNQAALKGNITNATMASGTIMTWSNVDISATKTGTNSDTGVIVTPARYIYSTGALSTTVSCYGKGPYAMNGRPFTVSIVTAGAYGTSIYVDGSNANAAPAETDMTGWRCISSPRWVMTQPLGGLDGNIDANAKYFSGVKWVRFRLEVAAQSNTTCNILGTE